jgi:ribosomal protein S18 acetylase RimI-like enzyme
MDDLTIERLTPAQAERETALLIGLLQDAVDSGASVGFLPPLGDDEAADYWRGVVAAMREGSRWLLVARDGSGRPLGTVQLDLCLRANGLHRAEVAKLLVHRQVRRRGIGRALMQRLEAEAQQAGRTTLVLDTRQGDPSERLYQALGYTRAGLIPAYALSSDGSVHTTALYYRLRAASPASPPAMP